MLTKVHTTEETVSVHGNEQEFDAVLFECLRVLRKRIADERKRAGICYLFRCCIAANVPTLPDDDERIHTYQRSRRKEIERFRRDVYEGNRTPPAEKYAEKVFG